MRILIVKTSSMGDIIHNLPIIEDILKYHPDSIFDWVVEESFAEILKLHPKINRIIPVAIRRWRKNLLSTETWREIRHFIKQIRAFPYDFIIDSQSLFKSAIIASLAIGKLHGQDKRNAREFLAAFFYHHHHSVPRNQHAVSQNRQLASHVLGYPNPTFPPSYGLPRIPFGTDNNFDGLTLPEKYVMAFHSTSRESKLWPSENWVRLGQRLESIGLSLVLPWGNDQELARAHSIHSRLDKSIVLPRLGLGELSRVSAGSIAAIGVDTGLIHLAVALNIPAIAIYTDTYPNLNGAFAAKDSIAINIGGKGQSPTPEEVFDSFAKLIS